MTKHTKPAQDERWEEDECHWRCEWCGTVEPFVFTDAGVRAQAEKWSKAHGQGRCVPLVKTQSITVCG